MPIGCSESLCWPACLILSPCVFAGILSAPPTVARRGLTWNYPRLEQCAGKPVIRAECYVFSLNFYSVRSRLLPRCISVYTVLVIITSLTFKYASHVDVKMKGLPSRLIGQYNSSLKRINANAAREAGSHFNATLLCATVTGFLLCQNTCTSVSVLTSRGVSLCVSLSC